jgi:membrane protein
VTGRVTEPTRTPAIRALALGGRFLTRLRFELRLTGLALWRGFTSFYSSNDLTFASSIAYYALLSLFPFFLLAFSVLGSVAPDPGERSAVLEFVYQYFPQQFDFVTAQLDALRRSSFQLGLAGTLLIIWASMGFFGAITSAVNHAWGVEKQPSYFKHKLVAFVMLVAASLLLVATVVLISFMNIIEATWFADVVAQAPVLTVLRSFAFEWATTVVFIIVVGLIFYFVPNANVRFRDVWVGAILTGLLWRAALQGFSWYMRDLSRLNMIHGSIAAVIVFLFWIFISAVIFLFGVEFTAMYARLRRRRPEDMPAAPTPRTEV